MVFEAIGCIVAVAFHYRQQNQELERWTGKPVPYGNRNLYLFDNWNGDKLSFMKEVGEILELDGKSVVNILVITEVAAEILTMKNGLKLTWPSELFVHIPPELSHNYARALGEHAQLIQIMQELWENMHN
ncbi:uncharacterized protein LOC126720738 [Quercus robur]|uniref:uncharacterized protein LOC126720738 n=1 Tax=Quercus robur TaxID=38942 RepID=UPI0021636873|nr:uncharacterized protein LOC126720738 [Quercus robur]